MAPLGLCEFAPGRRFAWRTLENLVSAPGTNLSEQAAFHSEEASMAPKPDRFEAARKDFNAAVARAKMAVGATADPAMQNMVAALGKYNYSLGEMLLIVSGQLDDIERQVRNVAARLDGKTGPFDLHMRK
jgi:hypothetical protein